MPRRRWLRWMLGGIAVLVAAFVVVSSIIDEPLRRYMERRVNASLKGYTVSIGELDLRLLGLSVELEDVTVVQNSRPVPPVAYVPRWTTSIEWRALLSLALVADTSFDRPAIFVTLDQTAQEARDPTPVSDRGWQDALEAVYPLKVNSFEIAHGTMTYFHGGAVPPVRIEHLDFEAGNIRNVRSRLGANPSPVTLRCTLLDSGRLRLDGRADFFAKPMPTVDTDFALQGVPLTEVAAFARDLGVTVTAGTLDVEGNIRHEPKETALTV